MEIMWRYGDTGRADKVTYHIIRSRSLHKNEFYVAV